MCALWLHSLPDLSEASSLSAGCAIVLPSLADLPEALAAAENKLRQAGTQTFATPGHGKDL